MIISDIPQQNTGISMDNLMIFLADDAGKYCATSDAMACHIPVSNPKNFTGGKKDIIVLGLKKTNPKFLPYLLKKELGHFILQNVTDEEKEKMFGIKKPTIPGASSQEEFVLRGWMDFMDRSFLLNENQKSFMTNKLNEIKLGTPEITHERLYKMPVKINTQTNIQTRNLNF